MKLNETKEVTIPNYEGSKVTLLSKAPWAAFTNITSDMTEVDVAIIILPHVIQKWNFDGDDGKPLEISEESVKLLPLDVVVFLMNQFAMRSSLKKKT